MKNFLNYFKKEKWTKGLLLSGIILLTSFPLYAGSIKEVNQSIKQVQSVEPPFNFALIGDSRDGEKVYARLMERILERKPQFLIHLGDMINIPHEKEWQGIFEIAGKIGIPFFPVAGNHDFGGTGFGGEIYRDTF